MRSTNQIPSRVRVQRHTRYMQSPVLSCFQRCNACCQYQTVNRLISQSVTEAANLAERGRNQQALESKKTCLAACPTKKQNLFRCASKCSLQCRIHTNERCKNSILRTLDGPMDDNKLSGSLCLGLIRQIHSFKVCLDSNLGCHITTFHHFHHFHH